MKIGEAVLNAYYFFSFYLFLGTAITGIIWALDVWVLAPRRSKVYHANSEIHQGVEIKRGGKEPVIVEYSKSFFPVLLIVFLLRGFFVEPFRIPSGSMLPSLYIGDFILVNKFAYGIRLPVWNRKVNVTKLKALRRKKESISTLRILKSK